MVAVNAPALDHDQRARSLLPRLVLRLYRRRRPPSRLGNAGYNVRGGIMKIPLLKKFLLVPRNLSWWVWLAIALCLTAGLMGYSSGFYAAIIISVIYALKEELALTPPGPSPFRIHRPLDSLPGCGPRVALLGANMGTFALILFGYRLMSRFSRSCRGTARSQ
jgi:hypothetical protein